METKTTDELHHEIKVATNIEDFLAKNKGQMLMHSLPGNRELYARDERDALNLFALQHKKNIFEINELLIDHNHTFLGTPNQ